MTTEQKVTSRELSEKPMRKAIDMELEKGR